ncbi:MAG: hypothetical protein AB7W28_08145 [Armatimonadota bacterium]
MCPPKPAGFVEKMTSLLVPVIFQAAPMLDRWLRRDRAANDASGFIEIDRFLGAALSSLEGYSP